MINVFNKEIIFPNILNCTQYCKEDFWRNIFEELAFGKPPIGTFLNKNYLCCNFKDKDFIYKIEKNKNTHKLYNEIFLLLTDKLGIMSSQDKLNKRIDLHNAEEKIKENRKVWTNIRKKNVKDYLIEKYVIDMKNKHNLSIKQSKYLLSSIFIFMIFKIITSKDILYKNRKIQSIKGIDYKDKKIIIHKKLYNKETSFAPSIVIEKKILSDNWFKYLNSLKKYN